MAASIHCVIVTPENTAFDEQVDFVVVPLIDGEAGIGDSHAPTIGRLGCGEVRVKTDGKARSYFVEGGFVQVDHNEVSVITEQAISAGEINVQDVEAALKEAESSRAETSDEKALRKKAIESAKAKLKVASKD